MNPVMIDPVEEQPDVDIQHEDYPLNVLDLADEPPILDMDIVDDHQVVEQENLPPPQNDQPALEENALPPEVIEPLDQQRAVGGWNSCGRQRNRICQRPACSHRE